MNGVKLEVTVLINNDSLAELKRQGYSDSVIARLIKDSISCNMGIIQEIVLVKYY